jgi:two-component system, NarL family, response regulator DesR
VPGESVCAGCRIDPTVWLVGLPTSVARRARAALIEDGLTPRSKPSSDADVTSVAIVGLVGAPAAEQRRTLLEATERLWQHRVVAVSDLERRSALHRLMATGVHGLVLAPDIERSLAATVRAVGAGQLCTTEQVRAALAPRPLSSREREILVTVILGLSNGEIARRLHISENTVKSHLASIFDKLGVRSRAEAAELVADPEDVLSTGIVSLSGGPRRG